MLSKLANSTIKLNEPTWLAIGIKAIINFRLALS